ncbi:MAG: glycosyltransferase family 4 protein [Candidatus Eisenbacteria bacterium]|nr:glycosyltransferase family 4 protein [Candidatus Eisenbacteria bacterium]
MRILLVADGFEATRPEETGSWLEDLAARLAYRGHRVTAVLAHWPEDDSPAPEVPGVAVWRPSSGGIEPVIFQALGQKPDVVHLASAGPWSEPVLQALLESPLVLDAHGYWPMCAAGDLIQRPSLTACPLAHPHEQCGACAGLLHLRAMDARAPLGGEARVVIAHTAAARERLEAGLGRPVDCVRPGVDAFAYTPEPGAPSSPDVAALLTGARPARVLVLGNAGQHRGAVSLSDLLVALNARLPGVEMIVPDSDPDDPAGPQLLLTEAREMGLGAQVHVFSGLTAADAPALFAACDVACLPGTLPESGGLRVMQAMSVGLPVVAHDAGSIGELITHGVEGLRIPSEPVGAFAHAIAALVRDPAGRAEYAERGRLAAMERFDIDRAVYAHEELYRRARRAEESGPVRRAPRRRAA